MLAGVAEEPRAFTLLVTLLFVSVLVLEIVGIVTHSTARTHAEALASVVSLACHTSSVPTHRASLVLSTTHDRGSPEQFVRVQLVGVQRIGVTRVGEVANTKAHEPVSSLITPFSSSDVVAANCDIFPVTSALSVLRLEKLVFITERELVTVSVQFMVVIVDILWYNSRSKSCCRGSRCPSIPSESGVPCIS